MNQIAERSERPSKPALIAGGAISAIVPQSIEECFRLSEAIHMSGMAPNGFDNPQKVMIAMMAGLEIGLPPMAAVQSVAVINNRPCIWGDALIGVVRKSPLCQYVSEWIEGEGDDMVAHCETHRKGEPRPVKMSFSVSDAKKAGLWQTEAKVTKKSRDGGTYQKDNDSPWYRYPKRMLQMRARSWCLRDVYADVTKGMQVREEVEDYQHVGPDNAKDITPSRPTVMERLQRARADTQEPTNQREGFSQSFTRDADDFTSDDLTGEIIEPDPETPEPGARTAPESDEPPVPPAQSQEAGDNVLNASPASDLFPMDRADLVECARKMFAILVTEGLTPETQRKVLVSSKDDWKAKLPGELHEHIKEIVTAAGDAIRGRVDRLQAIRNIATRLGCTPAEIGGA